MDPLASPASSGVDSPHSDESVPEVMSAPDTRTFSGDGAGGRRRPFAPTGNSALELKPGEVIAAAKASAAAASAAMAAAAAAAVAAARATPGNSSGEFSGSTEGGGGNSADSSAGRARGVTAGPAPPQKNVNAGGAPAKPLSTAFPDALAACWTCQTDDPFQTSDEERKNEIELKAARAAKAKLKIKGQAVVGSSDEDGEEEVEEGEDDEGDGVASDSSGSSGNSSDSSSLCLKAVSPSRVPPPLVSMSSSLPLPPVSITSSADDPFANFSPGRTWYSPNSPTASQAETPDTSMSWLKPLPPPPPRKVGNQTSQAPTHMPPPPVKLGAAKAFTGRWAQTTPPTTGEPKMSPEFEVKAAEHRRGF